MDYQHDPLARPSAVSYADAGRAARQFCERVLSLRIEEREKKSRPISGREGKVALAILAVTASWSRLRWHTYLAELADQTGINDHKFIGKTLTVFARNGLIFYVPSPGPGVPSIIELPMEPQYGAFLKRREWNRIQEAIRTSNGQEVHSTPGESELVDTSSGEVRSAVPNIEAAIASREAANTNTAIAKAGGGLVEPPPTDSPSARSQTPVGEGKAGTLRANAVEGRSEPSAETGPWALIRIEEDSKGFQSSGTPIAWFQTRDEAVAERRRRCEPTGWWDLEVVHRDELGWR